MCGERSVAFRIGRGRSCAYMCVSGESSGGEGGLPGNDSRLRAGQISNDTERVDWNANNFWSFLAVHWRPFKILLKNLKVGSGSK